MTLEGGKKEWRRGRRRKILKNKKRRGQEGKESQLSTNVEGEKSENFFVKRKLLTKILQLKSNIFFTYYIFLDKHL